MKKNILLINPWIYDFKAYDSWKKPLGLLYIASILEEAGYYISLIDCMDRTDESIPESFRKDDRLGGGQYFREIVKKPVIIEAVPRSYKKYGITEKRFTDRLNTVIKPDAVLVTSFMTYWYPGVVHVIKKIKELYPDVPLILGGIYATLCFTHAKNNSGADYIFSGNFNWKAVELINKILKNNLSNKGKDFFYYKPAYHLYEKVNSIAMITSLGCPYNCTYCASKIIQPDYMENSSDKIFDEIKNYFNKFNISHIAFYDDALLFNSLFHLEKILDRLIAEKMDINFYTPNGLHARYIDLRIAKKLKKTGFKELRVSLETSNEKFQISSGGKVSNDKFIGAIKNLKEAGYNSNDIGVYILSGLPGQNFDDIIRTMEFVNKNKVKIKLVNFSPLPGSIEWQKLTVDLQKKLELEPLLQNDIPFLWYSDYLDLEKNKKIKDLSKKMNESL